METATTAVDQRPVLRLLQPFVKFAQLESSSSLVLLSATLLALFLANSGFAGVYQGVLNEPLGLRFGEHVARGPIAEWVNDGLMAVFFLVVGLEVKRELLVGELASFSRAILPVLAALGGMVAPALIYLALNHGGPAQRGWGVPIATDIAFSLAILTAFGKRIPFALRIFLASLAIADDIGGVLVIAVAYTSHLHLIWLGATAVVFAVCLVMNRLGVTRLPIYLGMGAGMWVTLHNSGVHPTLSGILLALAIPSRSFLPPEHFVERGRLRLEQFKRAVIDEGKGEEAREPLGRLRLGLHLVESPLDRMQGMLHPWVSYGIMPLFALANAGISLHGFRAKDAMQPAFLGVALGLVVGKPIGITVFSWLAVKLRVAELPKSVTWTHVHAASWVAGIGFTVAIFVAGLAFGAGQQYTESRIAILMASTCAAVLGSMLLAFTPRASARAAESMEEETSAVRA